jgi:hypothetical protein
MLMVRLFEYSMTAGLFLNAIMLLLYPGADVYVYQMVYAGMMMCNLVALPLTKAIVGAVRMFTFMCNFPDSNADAKWWAMQYMARASGTPGTWLMAGCVSILISSCLFFVAGFLVFSRIMFIQLPSSGAPAEVQTINWMLWIMFAAFAFFGLGFFSALIGAVWNMFLQVVGVVEVEQPQQGLADENGGGKNVNPDDAKKCSVACKSGLENVRFIMGVSLVVFEFFNWFKWFIATAVVVGSVIRA